MPTINIKRSFYYQTRKPTDSYNYTISYLSYPVICTDGTHLPLPGWNQDLKGSSCTSTSER